MLLVWVLMGWGLAAEGSAAEGSAAARFRWQLGSAGLCIEGRIIRSRCSRVVILHSGGGSIPRPRRQRPRRRLPAGLWAGRLNDKLMSCRPEMQEMMTHAFSPPAMHRSYSAVKSAVVTAGDCLGQARSSTPARSLPLTMLAHEVEAWEGGGGERRGEATGPQLAWLTHPQPHTVDGGGGVAGVGVALRTAALLHHPSCGRGQCTQVAGWAEGGHSLSRGEVLTQWVLAVNWQWGFAVDWWWGLAIDWWRGLAVDWRQGLAVD